MQYMVFCLALSALAAASRQGTARAGDSCEPRTIFCADGDGNSARYLKCVRGQLVAGECANGSVCVGSKGMTLFCAAKDMENASITVTIPAAAAKAWRHSESCASTATSPSPLLMVATTLESMSVVELVPLPTVRHTAAHSTQQGRVLQHAQRPLRPTSSAVQWLFGGQPAQHTRTLPPALQSQVVQPSQDLPPPPPPQPPHLQTGMAQEAEPTAAPVPDGPSVGSTVDPAALRLVDNGPPTAPAVDSDIGGIAANQVLSVVGDAILVQHPELVVPATPTAAPTEESPTSSAPAPTSSAPAPTAAETGAADPAGSYRGAGPSKICTPGSFFCAEHGVRPGYFACDAVGLPLPASCGSSDVCYQFGMSILCANPGKAIRSGGMFG